MASVASTDHYVVVDTEAVLVDVVRMLEKATHIIMDLEGFTLGKEGGRLSVIIIRPLGSKSTPTYIIDAVALDHHTLQPLFGIIKADSPVKVVYDGRMDYSELCASFGVKMGKTVDVQIADVLSRGVRGESLELQLQRLPAWMKCIALKDPRSFTRIHNISSLGNCAKEHGITAVDKGKVDHTLWLLRPMSEEYLKYAADDARLIELIYETFLNHGLLTDDLAAISRRYISVWNGEKNSLQDRFRQHSVLPLNILDWVHPNPGRACTKCRRTLPTGYFSRKGRDCTICRFVPRKSGARRR